MATHDPNTTGTTGMAASDPTAFKPTDFNKNSTNIDNQYLPWMPGTTFVYAGAPGSNTKDTEIVTHDTKKIAGVNCVVVDDTVREAGKVTEHTLDYYAQDKKGNVWYFGEDSQTIQDGKVVSTEGSWLAGQVPEGGSKKAEPGVIMEANPQLYDSYNQENAYPVAQDHAEVLSLDAAAPKVPYGDYSNGGLLMTLETSAVEPGAAEVKYYAQGVGQVYGLDLVSQEQERLISVTTDKGVAQLVQAISSFGASAPGTGTLSSTATPNDPSLQQMLANAHA
jgi:hypothetical protein